MHPASLQVQGQHGERLPRVNVGRNEDNDKAHEESREELAERHPGNRHRAEGIQNADHEGEPAQRQDEQSGPGHKQQTAAHRKDQQN
ncbi:hypothetical protein D3C72_2017690 [compost metagenome]